MKVLHLIDSGGLYGAEYMLLSLMNEQMDAGMDVHLLSCGLPEEPEKAIEKEASLLNVNLIIWRIPAGFNFTKIKSLSQWIDSNDIDIVHSHGYKFNIMCAFGLKRTKMSKYSTVSTIHGYVHAPFFSKMAMYQLLDKIALCLFDHVVLVNNNLQKKAPFKWLSRKTTYIPNGIPKVESKVKAISSQNRFLAIGRLSTEKQFDILINTMNLVQNSSLTIMGDGPLKADLESLISQLKLREQVILKGFIHNPIQYFSDYDCLIISSSTEGLPIVLLEAMREGLPIISTPVGAIPNVLGLDYQLLCKTEMEKDILANIAHFISMTTEAKQELSLRLQGQFDLSYTSGIMHQGYEKLYQHLINSRKPIAKAK